MTIRDVYTATDQPEKCRKCGTRTRWRCLDDGRQEHRCPKCGYSYFLAEPEPEKSSDDELTCPGCGGTDFVVYQVKRVSATIAAKSREIVLGTEDDYGSLDEVYCGSCSHYLWDGSSQGLIEESSPGTFILPAETPQKTAQT